jgi:O-6-methylguanine DNA methyltransferase
MSEVFFVSRYASPLGEYILVSSREGIAHVALNGDEDDCIARWQQKGVQLCGAGEYNDFLAHELDAYFAGRLYQFRVPLDLRGTPFQRKVWKLICCIPYGETRSYRDLANNLGCAALARAVGRASGNNPVAIVVPCHRVVGATGNLVGYVGGLHRKRALLELESAVGYKKSGLCL